MKNVLTLCAIVLLCHFSTHAQDCFSYAGEDSRTCNFQDTLIGSPAGGTWFYPCLVSSKNISMETLNDSSVLVTYLSCGTYIFEYSVSIDSCFAVDTVKVDFENPSVANYTVDVDIELEYEAYDCQPDEVTSCNDNFQILGAAPQPLWTFFTNGFCSSTLYSGLTLDTADNCLVDSIFIAEFNYTGTLDSNLSTSFLSNEIVGIDSNDMVVENNFFNVWDQTYGGGISELFNDCPAPELCHSLPPECIDTTYFDTLTLMIPVHLGGYWTVYDDSTFIELDSNYSFMIDSFNYIINVEPSVENYNATFILQEINSSGDTVGITNSVDLTLKWEEEWGIDTIFRIDETVAIKDSCCRGGSNINRPIPIIPDVPTYDCPAFTLTFIPEMKTSDPIITCGDSTYIVSVSISNGIAPYDFDGIEGTIDGGIFTSVPIPIDSVNFSFNIFDSGECDNQIEGDNCICLMNANPTIFDLTIMEDCGSEGNGILLVEHLSGGHSPFLYSVDSGSFQADTLFENLNFGDYNLAVQDSFSCVTNIEFQVEPLEWEILEEVFEEKTRCGSENIYLELPILDSDFGDYLVSWEDGDSSRFRTVSTAGIYIATISKLSTCQQFNVTFDVKDLYFFTENDIKIPNAFTPNGDGLNDGFIPLTDDRIEVINYSLGIFNRWGNRVFSSNNHKEIWNPESKETSDVYIWFLDMKVKNCNEEIFMVKRSGDLTLIR